MAVLYGRHYPARYRAIAELIRPGSTVLDLCCGPGVLYRRYLRGKSVSYLGFDLNERFVKKLIHRGACAAVRDLRTNEPLPVADYVVMQASLYHFLPNPEAILGRMTKAASTALIVAEPIRNLADSKLSLVRRLTRYLTDPGIGSQPDRFTEQSLDELFAASFRGSVSTFFISGGREKIYVASKTQAEKRAEWPAGDYHNDKERMFAIDE